MARVRDTKAEYRRRQAKSFALYGKGYNAKGGTRARRQANVLAPGDVLARPKPLVARAGPQQVVKTSGLGAAAYLHATIRDAADNGQRVTITATFRNAAGEPRTRRMDRLPSGFGGASGGGPASGAGTGPLPVGAVQVTIGPGGVSAADLLEIIDDYYDGDVWEFLQEWWESMYGE